MTSPFPAQRYFEPSVDQHPNFLRSWVEKTKCVRKRVDHEQRTNLLNGVDLAVQMGFEPTKLYVAKRTTAKT